MLKWLSIFLFPLSLFALPLNNPALAELTCDGVFFNCGYGTPRLTCDTLSVRVGYYGDFIFNNNLKVDRQGRGSIRLTRLYTNGGELDFNFWNRFEVFGVLGVSNILLQAPISNFSVAGAPVNSLLEIATDADFAWSVGARGQVWNCGRFIVGVEGQYYRTNPLINFVADHFSTTPAYLDDVHFTYQSWQVGLGATYEICINSCFSFLPYASLAFAGAHVDMNNTRVVLAAQNTTVELFDLIKDRYFGYGFGGTLAGGERVLITAEGRFSYEKALFISIQMRL